MINAKQIKTGEFSNDLDSTEIEELDDTGK